MTSALSVKDVGQADFKESVIDESFKRPVLVDFWAAWCGPCRVLGPVLEKLAVEFGGDFLLAKIDTETNPDLAQEFDIRSIPNVKLFKGGELVDEFLGAISESEARAFIKSYCPDAADQKYREAMELLSSSNTTEARLALEEALRIDPKHAPSLLELGKLLLGKAEPEAVEALWNQIPPSAPEWAQAHSLKASLQFWTVCRQAGGATPSASLAATEPTNLNARYAHGCCLAAERDFRASLEEFLFVLSRDKGFQDQAARKAMLSIFSLVGERDPLSEEFRKKLAFVLF